MCTRNREGAGTRESMVLAKKARLESGGGWLRWKWIFWTLEPPLYEPRVLYIEGGGFLIPSLSNC